VFKIKEEYISSKKLEKYKTVMKFSKIIRNVLFLPTTMPDFYIYIVFVFLNILFLFFLSYHVNEIKMFQNIKTEKRHFSWKSWNRGGGERVLK